MKTTKLMAGLALVASTLLTTAPVLAQEQNPTKDSTASLTIEAGERNIDSVPELNFKVKLSGNITASSLSSDQTNPIKLSDYTGSLSGWTLNVKRSAFTATINSDTATLDGVTLKLTGGSFNATSDDVTSTDTNPTPTLELDTENAEKTVATATEGTGSGATTINYTGATLKLPDITKKVKVGTYKSELTWTLTDAPKN